MVLIVVLNLILDSRFLITETSFNIILIRRFTRRPQQVMKPMKKLELCVSGMKCSSCEVLIERKLQEVPGVKKVKVSRAREKAQIECREDIKVEDLQKALEGDGYTLSTQQLTKKRRYAEIGAVFLFIIGAYLLLKQFDILPQGLGISDSMSYGFIFMIGLVAATSTCLAVAGGLLLAVAGKFNERHPNLTGWQKFQPHISFNIGRIVSYTLFGGLIGMLGSVLTISPKATGLITVGASLLMILMGLQMLQIFPGLDRIQLKMPKFIAHKIYAAGHDKEQKSSRITSFFFGGLTFFLPCGFTQALQLYVLGTGDFLTGALTMLAFSLGTLPALAGIGAFSSFAKGRTQKHFMTFSAVLVIILGLVNVPNGLALTGATASVSDAGDMAKIIDGKQIVEMKIVGLDYYPSNFKVLQGVPVEWRVDGSKAEGCAQVISIPSLNKVEFVPPSGIKTIEFVPEKAGKISFSCTMGMTTYGAGFEVVSNTEVAVPTSDALAKPEAAPACNPEYQQCNVQKIQMEVSRERGFYPNVLVVKKGIPVEWEIDTKLQIGGCMGTMVIPEYGVAHRLALGKTTLRFTPTRSGTFPFTCSMGSKMGDIVVT